MLGANHKQSSIISLHGVPPKLRGNFPKKDFDIEQKFFGKTFREVILNGRTHDQIMSR